MIREELKEKPIYELQKLRESFTKKRVRADSKKDELSLEISSYNLIIASLDEAINKHYENIEDWDDDNVFD